jgi:membrane protein
VKFLIPIYSRHLSHATVRSALINASRCRLPGLAAEMAYNAMLAMFPLILTVMTAVGLFNHSSQLIFQAIMDQLRQVAPAEAVVLVDTFVRDISTGKNISVFSLSFLATVWAATGAIGAAMTALDLSHRGGPGKLRPFWKNKLISLLLMLVLLSLVGIACGVLFFSGLVVREMAMQAGSLGLHPLRSLLLWLWSLFTWPISFGLILIANMLLYRYGPSQRRLGTPLFPGALSASLLWLLVSAGLRLYLQHFGHYNQAYGAVGAVIVLLLWLWLSSLALLFGDQINIALYEAMKSATTLSATTPSTVAPLELPAGQEIPSEQKG